MKKLITLCACIATVFSLTACSSKIDEHALTALSKGIQNLEKMQSTDYKIDVKVKAEEEESSMNVHGSFNLKDKSDPRVNIHMDMVQQETTFKDYVAIYVNSEAMYINMMNAFKQKMPLSSVPFQYKDALPKSKTKKGELDKKSLKNYLKEASMKDNKITIVLDTEKINPKLSEYIRDIAKEQGLDTNSANLDVALKEAKLEAALEKDMMNDMTMTAKLTSNKQDVELTIHISFSNINKDVKVEFPDVSEYSEVNNTNLLNPTIQQ